jgi:GMP synthase (glutamine-hydrolysing)
MRVVIIMHIQSEGPGSLGDYLEKRGAGLDFVRLYAGDKLPEISDCDAIVSLGGPMNVDDEDKYPFLAHETGFLRRAFEAKKPVLGICLGAQMIAKAAGARVVKSPQKEVGWSNIDLTEEGAADPIFKDLPHKLEVLQWHEDMFEIPNGGKLLAESKDCPHQALRYANAVGLQFHVEVTKEILADWFAGSPDNDKILARYDEVKSKLIPDAEKIFNNFVNAIK